MELERTRRFLGASRRLTAMSTVALLVTIVGFTSFLYAAKNVLRSSNVVSFIFCAV
jgi:hypothetical protein